MPVGSRTCNCTIPLTNPDACKTCTVGTSGVVIKGGPTPWSPFPPYPTPTLPETMTPARVREIVREELKAQSASLLKGAEPIRLQGVSNARDDEQLRRFIGLELQKYAVDINEDQLRSFVRDTIASQLKDDYVRHMSQKDWLDIKSYVDAELKRRIDSLSRDVELTEAEVIRISDKLMPRLIAKIDERVKASLATLGRIIGQFSIDKI